MGARIAGDLKVELARGIAYETISVSLVTWQCTRPGRLTLRISRDDSILNAQMKSVADSMHTALEIGSSQTVDEIKECEDEDEDEFGNGWRQIAGDEKTLRFADALVSG